jgi:F-box-like
MSNKPLLNYLNRSVDQKREGGYNCSNESWSPLDPSASKVLAADRQCFSTADYSGANTNSRISHCESSVPSFCSEDRELSDCSSILSSISNQSFNYWEGASKILSDLSSLRGEEAIPMANIAFDFPPECVLKRLVSVVSLGTTRRSADESSLFEGTEMDEDSISFVSSLEVDELQTMQVLSLTFSAQYWVQNFFADLPDELLSSITVFLDVESLCQFRLVSRRARIVSSRDEAGWKRHCQNLWSQKAFVLKEARQLYKSRNAMCAYKLSIYDAKHRDDLRPEELFFDPRSGEGIIWEFRFKETAGVDWTSFDPWWTGGKARKMVFLSDGTVKQITQSHNSNVFSLYPPFSDATKESTNLEGGSDGSISHFEMTWRFVEQPMDLPKRTSGSYIRITFDGRDVPTYVVHRSPTGDWGFVIESCWGVYSSTPLPRRQILSSRETPSRRTRMRLRRTRDGARWLNVEGIETDSEDEDETVHADPNVDSTFSMSTRSQWREALLYNYGAISLPEGEHASAEFDRVWSQSLRRGRT